MTEELNKKLSHLYWLDQWKEIKQQAEKIIKDKTCPDSFPSEFSAMVELDLIDYQDKKIKYEDCLESIMSLIMIFTPPRLENKKY